jgi:glycosyltransferase involved in cell wall biosynthesis
VVCVCVCVCVCITRFFFCWSKLSGWHFGHVAGINIVILSRLVYRKGVDLVVEVIPEICKRFPNVYFIIGTPWVWPSLWCDAYFCLICSTLVATREC